MRSIKFSKLCLSVALGILVLRGQVFAQSALERINAIYASLAGDHAALYVAQEMGLFRKYGLDVNLSYTAGAAQVIQTMMAGENQIATAGGSGVVDADFAGADLVAVAGMVNIPPFISSFNRRSNRFKICAANRWASPASARPPISPCAIF